MARLPLLSAFLFVLPLACVGPPLLGAGESAWFGPPAFENGDTNGDWSRDVTDGIYLLNHLYNGSPAPAPLACGIDAIERQNGDTNGDGDIDITDPVALLAWLFLGGPEPVEGCEPIGGAGAGSNGNGYKFKLLAVLGDPAPGGSDFTFDFEPTGINNRGEVSFGADLTSGGEGVFLRKKTGELTALVLPGDPVPGGGTYSGLFFIRIPLNDQGDAALHLFLTDPFLPLPQGLNSGIYRFSQTTGALSAVIVPGVTPAPGGGVFQGATIASSINNRGDIVFAGIVSGADIDPSGPPGFDGLGVGVFKQDRHGNLSSVVRPGDPAPGGGVFDFAENPWINDAGDVAFGAHVAGEECMDLGVPQSVRILCGESSYVKKAATGEIVSIAHQGQSAPGGGTFSNAFGPAINARGQVVFIGDLTHPSTDTSDDLGVFLYSQGELLSIARPGDPMPGGGTFARSTFFINTYHLNNRGEVTFTGFLDDGSLTGLFSWSRGTLRLVVRSGTVIPGLGTVLGLTAPDLVGTPFGALESANDRGEVLFTATLDDGTGPKGVLLVAIPAN